MATTWGNSRMYLPICKELEKKKENKCSKIKMVDSCTCELDQFARFSTCELE